jgi:hypothetical protein
MARLEQERIQKDTAEQAKASHLAIMYWDQQEELSKKILELEAAETAASE